MNKSLLIALRNAVYCGQVHVKNDTLYFRKSERGLGAPLPPNQQPTAWLAYHQAIILEPDIVNVTREEVCAAVEYLVREKEQKANEQEDDSESTEVKEYVESLIKKGQEKGKFRLVEDGSFQAVQGSASDVSSVAEKWLLAEFRKDRRALKKKQSASDIVGVDDQEILINVEIIQAERKTAGIVQLRKHLSLPAPKKNRESLLVERCEALTTAWSRQTDPTLVRFNGLALYQTLWQLKRKLNDLPVTDHLCIFIYGSQNTGKSTALRKLFKPIPSYLSSYTDMDKLSDRGMIEKVLNSLVTVVEEVTVDKRQVNMLKNFITEDERSNRALYAKVGRNIRNTTTLFGTTNIPVLEIVDDPTGSRRFWEITQSAESRMDFDVVNGFDYLELLRLVDESIEESPLQRSGVIAEFRREQERNTRLSTIEYMIEDLLRFETLSKVERDAKATKSTYFRWFGEVCNAGLIKEMRDPEKWIPRWESKRHIVFDAYAGVPGARAPGYHNQTKAWDRVRDMNKFQKEFYRILLRRFGPRPMPVPSEVEESPEAVEF